MPFEIRHQKKGGRKQGIPNKSTKQIRENLIVTPAGFEPATNRAEICHSIQLNYGVKMKAKILIF